MTAWTKHEDEVLKTVAHRGGSFAEAAELLGRTRNAVAGRADRTGIPFYGDGRPRPVTPLHRGVS